MSSTAETARTPSDDVRHQWMVQAAKLYFELDRTKSDIADELGLTRWQVARLLKDARESGVVRIDIAPRIPRRTDLEVALQQRFNLREAVVVPGLGQDDGLTAQAVARAAADYLTSLPLDPALIGVSWGRTMAAVARWLPAGWRPGIHVVLVNGATSLSDQSSLSHSVAEAFAAAAGGRATIFPAPAIVGRAETRQVLEDDPVIARVLGLASAAPVVCFGLGGLEASIHVDAGYIDTAAVERLRAAGAVGDILGRFIRADGGIADPALDSRTLGLPLSALKAKRHAIGVVSGRHKHPILKATLTAGIVNGLVTDEASALSVLTADI